ncbi:MAG: asparagine synthase (glutamine-hydrolyzing) [Pelistega sp.]|nr:asparagine synthase (glutamine-hydrolyzing) [Pelistega sp.]
MCGIIGLIGQFSQKQEKLEQACERLKRRGPDSRGVWLSADQKVGLAHVRLAIQDLSEHGHQPMLSADQRYVMVFNGEIYNHFALRDALGSQAPQWRGHSDTETLLACFVAWGVEQTLRQAVGMFAFALWDQEQGSLVLGRDRFGEKPLYYTQQAQGLLFASELKAFMPIAEFDKRINRGAVALLMRHNYIPAPHTIFERVYKLPPASYLQLDAEHLFSQHELPEPKRYWSAYEVAKRSSARVFADDDKAIDAFERVLSDAVQGQMLADVSLGAFLSGGTDSSLIVAMMQKQSTQAVKTFAIGFEEQAYNEAPFAKAVAEHLGTDHTELYMNGNDALTIFQSLADVYSEPFADSSQLPVLLMMGLTAQHVKVALSGDAGDELFGGYKRYARAQAWWDRCQKIPSAMRPTVAKMLSTLASSLPLGQKQEKCVQFAQLLRAKNTVEFYRPFVSYWKQPENLVLQSEALSTCFDGKPLRNLQDTMQILDTLSYLPDDILVKVDRAAMYHSLETRVPLLDHRVFEFVWDIHPRYKQRDGQSKWLMKQLLYRHVPQALLERPKKGFSVPLGQWLRGPMKTWASDLLSQDRLQQQGLFDASCVQRIWQQHQQGAGDWSAHLWGILMMQAWLDTYQIRV